MGYADGYYYGQGRIICDTSTFSVGDTIRVRSMTDSSKVWNQQVATVGTALVFTVPPYDYYKICTVQDIGGVATEVGGVYKTVDFGQTMLINVLDKSTIKGIKGIVDSHNESVLSIGAEVKLNMADDSIWTMQIADIDGYDSHEVILVSKYTNAESYQGHYQGNNYLYSQAKAKADAFYSLIEAGDKACISQTLKEAYNDGGSPNPVSYNAYVWNPNAYEVFGSGYYAGTAKPLHQFPIFITQANRVRQRYDTQTSVVWGLGDMFKSGSYWYQYDCNTSGNFENYTTSPYFILPCLTIKADS